MDKILDAASGLDRWILWTDADNSFGLTPESFDRVLLWVRKLKPFGCIGMAVSISNPLISYYAKKVIAESPVPYHSNRISRGNQGIYQRIIRKMINP